MNVKSLIRTIPDWPKKGINFRDITPLLQDANAFQYICETLYQRYKDKNIHKVVGIEARGFIFAPAIAYHLKAGFVPARKQGKLPHKTIGKSYGLEYGEDTIEIHEDAIQPNDNVLIIDDLIATGGTIRAVIDLVEQLKGQIVECSFVIELSDIIDRANIGDHNIFSLVQYDSAES